MTILPRLDGPRDPRPGPGWVAATNAEGRPLKPYLRCRCGKLLALSNHSVYANGRVEASFLHDEVGTESCGWHDWLTLDDYDGPTWRPGEGR